MPICKVAENLKKHSFRTHNPLVAGSNPAGPSAEKARFFYIEDSRLVREVANLAPNFGDYHKPIENRIEQLRGFGKTFVPLRDACEKEPDLVLAPIGAPSLTVVGKAA